MYLPALTDDELLRYASTQQLTPLEKELVRRFTEFQDETGDKDAEIEELEKAAESSEARLNEEISDLAEAHAKIEELETELRESLA